MTEYPTEYRGNTIYDEKQVSELSNDLLLVTDQHSINKTLSCIGVTHDLESVVLEDSYGCLFVETEDGDYAEVWGIHKSTPYLSETADRLR